MQKLQNQTELLIKVNYKKPKPLSAKKPSFDKVYKIRQDKIERVLYFYKTMVDILGGIIVLYCIVLYCIVLYCISWSLWIVVY
jgi:hypothetical protein